VDCFISEEYTYRIDKVNEPSVDDRIMEKLKYCEVEKKERILKMIDLL
jgi:hypothetical protein